MIALVYASEIIEETILLAESSLPAAERRAFRRERDRLYEVRDDDDREMRFRWLHQHWFLRLGLGRDIERVIADRLHFAHRLREGRIVAAISRREEGADLVDRMDPDTGNPEPLLVVRLRPQTLLDPPALRVLLQHELMHVADMLDPAFGYERTLPPSGDGPAADTIVRDRYRVLWDITIDGRLAHAGHAVPGRTRHQAEFATMFPKVGRDVFDHWFDLAQPTHAALAAYAGAPDTNELGVRWPAM